MIFIGMAIQEEYWIESEKSLVKIIKNGRRKN